jgi:hypothetical protein
MCYAKQTLNPSPANANCFIVNTLQREQYVSLCGERHFLGAAVQGEMWVLHPRCNCLSVGGCAQQPHFTVDNCCIKPGFRWTVLGVSNGRFVQPRAFAECRDSRQQ